MNIKKNITINLSEDDVKEIIAEYCNKNGYKVKPEDVELLVDTRYVGFRTELYEEHYSAGAKVIAKED